MKNKAFNKVNYRIKGVIIFLIMLIFSTNSISLFSQTRNPKDFKYFQILASIDDDSVFIQLQEEMQIIPKSSTYILTINILDDDPSKHYIMNGFENDAEATRTNFYTLSKKTRKNLLGWNMENKTDLQNPIYYNDNQWTKKETNQQREEREKKKVEKYSKEISDYNKALELDSNKSDIIAKIEKSYRNRGEVYEDLEEYSKAISDYTKSIKIKPKNYHAHSLRGFLYFRMKEYSNAISDFEMAFKYDSSRSNLKYKIIDCFYKRADNYYDFEEYSKAISDYKKVIELDSSQQKYQHEDIYSRCGLAYIGNKEYLKAISIYDKLLENNPKYSLAYLFRGIANSKNKNITKGCEDLQKALILGIPNAKKMIDKYCE